MNSIINLLISSNWKSETYISILVIVDNLIKMIYYNLVKITIDILSLAKVIIDVVISHYDILQSIITD